LKLAEMPPGLERDALAMKNFGAEFTRVLNAGGIELDTFISKLTPLSEAQVRAAAEVEEGHSRVAAAWTRLLQDPGWEKFTNLLEQLNTNAFKNSAPLWEAFGKA